MALCWLAEGCRAAGMATGVAEVRTAAPTSQNDLEDCRGPDLQQQGGTSIARRSPPVPAAFFPPALVSSNWRSIRSRCGVVIAPLLRTLLDYCKSPSVEEVALQAQQR